MKSLTATRGFSPTGMVVLLASSVAWSVAWLAGIEVAHQALLPVLLLASVATFGGWRVARVAALPVGYLYFAIPVWDQVNGLLQQLTIVAVTGLLKLLAIPAYIDGPYVHLGSGSFEIAGGCSGLHFFIVACAIAVLFGEQGRDTLRTRIKLVLIAGAMAMVMNWVRVATIIIAGYLTDMQSFLVKVDHYYFGWALFGVLLVIFYWLVPRWLKLQHNPPPPLPAPAPALPRGRFAAALVVTVVLLALVPTLALRAQTQAQTRPRRVPSRPARPACPCRRVGTVPWPPRQRGIRLFPQPTAPSVRPICAVAAASRATSPAMPGRGRARRWSATATMSWPRATARGACGAATPGPREPRATTPASGARSCVTTRTPTG